VVEYFRLKDASAWKILLIEFGICVWIVVAVSLVVQIF
jgi:hypothetical protein